MSQPDATNPTTNWRHVLRRTRDTSIESTSEGVEGVGRFLVYAALGVAVGAVVVGIEWLAIEQILHALIEAPLWVQVLAPGIGLMLTAIILHVGWNTKPTDVGQLCGSVPRKHGARAKTYGPQIGWCTDHCRFWWRGGT